MSVRALPYTWLDVGDRVEPEVRVLLADHDPISRHVLSSVLSTSWQLRVVASVDCERPVREWPLANVDVVVLGVGPVGDHTRTARDLAAHQLKVLLVGVGWSRRRLDAAFASGVAGCVVKDMEVERLGAATRAVASGHVVLSPELLQLYTGGGGAPVAAPAVESRLSDHLLLRLLTTREREVLAMLATGCTTAEAAAQLKVSPATVKSHVSHMLTKLGVRNRLEAVLLMQRVLDSRAPAESPPMVEQPVRRSTLEGLSTARG
ncbi:response regulator transcription factor [Actinomycetes bacterium KLBMP 9759]